MIRIINFRVDVKEKKSLEELLSKKYSPLRDQIRQIHVVRKAVDARKKPHITFVYTLFLEVDQEERVLKKLKNKKDVSQMNPEAPAPIVKGSIPLKHRPVIVGFGPSGMLAALYLAREGYAPIVLERGADADTRTKDVEKFWRTGKLDVRSNVQFGEGGAGTFSDGKLTTRVTHPRLHEIAQYFVDFGAPPEILYKHKPHVGTDILRHMVKKLREQVIAWGGEVHFHSQVTDIIVEDNRIAGVIVNGKDKILTETVIAGIGHSARDTYEMLFKKGVDMESKPLAIGVRIEHKQSLIDQSQYGTNPEELGLGAAEYSLVYHDKESGRTAYTFCMCPGGHVVASASEEGGVVTNGMSCYARASGVANSALVVTVGPEDFGEHPLGGIAFQRKWEEKAFQLGGRNYKAPMQQVGNFLKTHEEKIGKKSIEILGNQSSEAFAEKLTVMPDESYEGMEGTEKMGVNSYGPCIHTYEPGVVLTDLHDCLPPEVTAVMARALPYFGQKIKGFDDPAVCMTGVETRTSAPIRMGRSDYMSKSHRGFYPVGEGAGYAGGIMSAALDGAEAAIAFMAKYAPFEEKKNRK